MKKTIAFICIAASTVALAASVESLNTFGVLKVTSDKKETALCVPWSAVGSGNVKVKDFVMTSNLTRSTEGQTDGDWLLKYDGAAYKGWYLDNTGAWKGFASSYTSGGVTTSFSSDENATLARGDSLILIRKANLTNDNNAIYLYGQYNGAFDGTLTMGADTTGNNERVTLFAMPNTSGSAFDLNDDGWTWSGVVASTNFKTRDKIRLQAENGNTATFVYKNGQWIDPVTSEVTGAKIKPGMGAWYIAVATGSTRSAPTWTKK